MGPIFALKIGNIRERYVKKNVGDIDGVLRVVFGFLVISAGFYFQSYWALFGAVPVAIALVEWCPLYALFNFSTQG